MANFSARSKAVESACKAYAYRSPIQAAAKKAKLLKATLDYVEQFPVGSPEWKVAVKANAAILSDV